MTAMGMTMDNSMGNITSDVEVAPNAQAPLHKVKKNSAINSTFVKPLAIVGGLLTVGVVVATVKIATPEAEVRSIDGGEVDTILVDNTLTGADELDSKQAQFIADQQYALAEKNAKEGVNTAAVVNRAKVSSTGVSYSTSAASDASAITTEYHSVPKTLAQLTQANAASGGMLYQETIDDNGNIIFMNRETKEIIYPIDVPRSNSLTGNTQAKPAPNSTAATNYNEQGGGEYNDGGSGGGNGANGGGQQGSATGSGQDQDNQAQQPRPTGAQPLIESRREILNNDFTNQQAQREALAAQAAQADQARIAQYQQAQQYRTESANEALNNAIASVKESTGSPNNNRYKPVSYIAQNNNGGSNQNQGGYSSQGGYLGGNNQGGYSNNQGYSSMGGQGFNPNQGYNTMGGLAGQPTTMPIDPSYGSQPVFDPQNNPQTLAAPNMAYPSQGNQVGGYYGALPSPYAPNAQQQYGFDGQAPDVNNSSQGIIMDNRLPINVIRAGTKWQAVITKSVNTDEGLQVIGELVTGKFAGSTVYGVIEQSGRDIGVRFTSIAPPNPRKPLIPLSAYATTIGGQKTAVSTDKKNHYLQNYGIMTLTSILQGVGDAYEDSGETSVITDSGNIITTKPSEPSSKKIRGEVLGELGEKLNEDISKLGGRAATYKVAIGTVVNVVLSDDLDINGTASSIGNAAQSSLAGAGSTNR